MVRIHNEESEDRTIWDVWLHRIFDMDFNAFYDKAKSKSQVNQTNATTPKSEEVKEAIKNSVDILNGFCPS